MADVKVPKLQLRVSGDRIYCGRSGCDREIGRVTYHPGGLVYGTSKGNVVTPPAADICLAESNYGESRDAPQRWFGEQLENGTRV